jgi:hypothetical protein
MARTNPCNAATVPKQIDTCVRRNTLRGWPFKHTPKEHTNLTTTPTSCIPLSHAPSHTNTEPALDPKNTRLQLGSTAAQVRVTRFATRAGNCTRDTVTHTSGAVSRSSPPSSPLAQPLPLPPPAPGVISPPVPSDLPDACPVAAPGVVEVGEKVEVEARAGPPAGPGGAIALKEIMAAHSLPYTTATKP